MEEIWKDVKGYEGRYMVSNLGNVMSVHYLGKTMTTKDNGNRLLKQIKKGTGYYVVSLCNKQYHVHRLVAEAFLENVDNKPCIDHINTITTDNRVDNLRWCTQKENLENPISKEKRLDGIRKFCKGKFGKDSIKHRCVYQYSNDGVFIKKWDCMSDACRYYNIDSGSMTRACQGLSTQAKGYIWSYEYKNPVNKPFVREKPILQYDKNGNLIKEWSSVTEAVKFYKTSSGRLCSCLKGHTKTCRGYKWIYK